jgi:asparagine N-glycosylation enzyme membrane subunit Stt3
MDKQKVKKIAKAVAIIIIIMAFCFALRAHAADISIIPNDMKATYTDSDGLPYFSEMDSYFNLRMTQDYMDHGYFGDTMINGTAVDMHRNSPDGVNASFDPMISWVTIGLYDVVNTFHSMSLKEVAFYTGAVIACLAVIPAYIFTRRITNDYGAVTAAIMIGLAPNYFSHTFAGFFDTDMFNVTLPLFIFLFFVESIRNDNPKMRIIYSILTVITVAIFSISWQGYTFYAALLVLMAIVYYVLAYLLKIDVLESRSNYSNKFQWFIHQRMLCSIIIIMVLGLIGVILTSGISSVASTISGLFSLLSLQSAGGGTSVSGFPNVYISVAEMQIPNLLTGGISGAFLANSQSVINGIGGIVAMFGALAVLYLYTHRLWKLRSIPSSVNVSGKPSKGKRKTAAQKKDENNRFNLALKDLTSLGSVDDINKNKRLTLLYFTVFMVWVVSCIIAVTQGTRFIMTLMIPLGLCVGIFVGYAVDYVKAKVEDERRLLILCILCSFLVSFPVAMQVNNISGIILFIILAIISAIAVYGGKFFKESDISFKKTAAVLLITLAIVSPTVCGAYQTASQVVPGTSDPMWNSMAYINGTANGTISSDAVIESWWDYGYLFEIAANKQTASDGGQQSGDRAFWMGRAMTTSNLDLSKSILQMLATSGTKAGDTLNNYTGNNSSKSTDILLNTLPMSKVDAKNAMINNYSLTEAQANNVLQYSHPDHPRDVVFVASSDMLQKAGWWTYFGTWNFAEQNSTSLQYMVSTTTANITPGHSGTIPLLDENGISFNAVIHRGANGTNNTTGQVQAVFDNNNTTVSINGTNYNPLKASNVMVIEDNYLTKNETIHGATDGNYTLFILGNNNTYNAILIDNKLVDSMFTRLFLLGGNGQNQFQMIHMESGVSLWKVNNNATSTSTSVTNSTG